VWQRLDHRNVLPLYGITTDFGIFPSMVCEYASYSASNNANKCGGIGPWLENGNLSNYLARHGNAFTLSARLQSVSTMLYLIFTSSEVGPNDSFAE
jgi:hypothetical protein